MLSASEISARRAGFDRSTDSWLQNLFAQPHLRVLLLQDANRSESLLRLVDALHCERVVLAQLTSPLSRVHEHASALRAGMCLPVGSREFVRACMRAAGIDEPQWEPYPRTLLSHMLCRPRKVAVGAALQWAKPMFIKPAAGSPFAGFVLRENLAEMTSRDKAHFVRLLRLSKLDPVWVAEELPIATEWRYYILDGQVIGYAPSTSFGQAVAPCIEEVSSVVAAAPQEGAFALDMGVLKDGTTTLLCVRDAWAVEWYPFGSDAPSPLAFLHFLWTRWCEMHLEPRQCAANSSIL